MKALVIASRGRVLGRLLDPGVRGGWFWPIILVLVLVVLPVAKGAQIERWLTWSFDYYGGDIERLHRWMSRKDAITAFVERAAWVQGGRADTGIRYRWGERPGAEAIGVAETDRGTIPLAGARWEASDGTPAGGLDIVPVEGWPVVVRLSGATGTDCKNMGLWLSGYTVLVARMATVPAFGPGEEAARAVGGAAWKPLAEAAGTCGEAAARGPATVLLRFDPKGASPSPPDAPGGR